MALPPLPQVGQGEKKRNSRICFYDRGRREGSQPFFGRNCFKLKRFSDLAFLLLREMCQNETHTENAVTKLFQYGTIKKMKSRMEENSR